MGGALVGLAIVVVVAIAAALALRDDDGSSLADGDRAPTSTEADPAPTDPTTAGETTTIPAADLDAAIDEAIAFVEAERQRQFTTRPAVEALDETTFVERYNALIDEAVAEDPQGIEAATVIYRAFGLIDPDEDIVSVERSFGSAGVLGYYDPERNELVVRGGDITPFFRTVLVHELTHALDDQLVELDRPEYDDSDDEVSFGLSAVAEGNARRVELAYYDTLSRDDQRSADDEEAGYGAGLNIDDFNISYLVLQFAPYEFGQAFVDELLDRSGEDGIDEALRNPPTTSEQVLYLGSYIAREPRREISRPIENTGGVVVEDGSLGQVPIMAILSASVSQDEAFAAADGWAGDWYVAWTEGTSSCVRTTMVMESFEEAQELRDGFDSWADDQSGRATVFYEEDRVVVTNCVG